MIWLIIIQIIEGIKIISQAEACEKFSEVQSKIDLSETITSYVISLDSKSRLVLPLEIRDSLGLDKNNRKLTLKLFKDNDSLLLKLEKSDLSDGKLVSRNCMLL
jgi:hypothetical protein